MKHYDYSVFTDLIEKYQSKGFQNIQRSDPFILDLDIKLEQNKQFFCLLDLIRFKIFFISSGIKNLIGINPDDFEFGTFLGNVSDEDLERFSLARTKYVKSSHDLFIRRKGSTLMSANFRIQNLSGKNMTMFYQSYMFYSEIPSRTVYALLLITDITHLEKGKHAYHFYTGHDISNFRYPDSKLLDIGRQFSQREFDILKLIAAGMDSEEIAKKLFLSVNTVNTHRRNVLKKTNKSSTHELVIELKETGVL